MSARQNKKQRKGRNNANNRERTVTTLTEDPNTPYLVPTPSEEPAGANLMSSPFSVASSSAGNPNNLPGPAYIPGNFGYGYPSFVGPMHGNVHHQQHQQQQPQFFPSTQQQQPVLPPGQNDLEVLEKLKDIIKNGQHEFYRAIPQPAALANIYLGSIAANQSQVPHHPEQPPQDFHMHNAFDGQSQANPPPGNSGPPSPVDVGRRPPRIQNKEGWDPSGSRKPVASTVGSTQPTNNTQGRFSSANGSGAPSLTNTNNSNNGKANSVSSGPSSASKDIHRPMDTQQHETAPTTNGSVATSPSQRSGRFESTITNQNSSRGGPSPIISNMKPDQARGEPATYGGARVSSGDTSADKGPAFDGKGDVPREGGWSHRESAPDDRRRDLPPQSARPIPNGTNNGSDVRIAGGRPPSPVPPPRDQRFYDRERDRSRDRDRDRDRERDIWDRDRDRERRLDYRYERPRMTDMRRPPPELRHYEPDYDRPSGPFRRFDSVKGPDDPLPGTRRLSDPRPPASASMSADERGVRPPPPADDRSRAPSGDSRPPVDARISHPDSRAPPSDSRVLPPDNRSAHGPPPGDDRHARPLPSDDRRGPPPADDRTSRPPAPASRPVETSGVSRSSNEDRSGRTPAPAPPLSAPEDRNARPQQVPLEDRISRPTLQDRLSQPPTPATVRGGGASETNRLSRQASLEERLSHAPLAATTDHGTRQPDDRLARPGVVSNPNRDHDRVARPGSSDERNARGNVTDPARPPPPQDDRSSRPDDRTGRPVDRYVRPVTPSQSDGILPPAHRAPAYAPPPPVQRAASVVRDDPRTSKISPSPPHRAAVRDYRPLGRDMSRDRPDFRAGSYRPDIDRSYTDDRRSDAMDIDHPPARFTDNRLPYTRRFSPPSAADLARDRVRAQYPPMSPPPRAPPVALDPPPYDDPDRRFPPAGGRDWQYQQYGERRREWNATEEDNYWKARPHWDRNNPPSDRDRFERDVPPPPPPPPPQARNHGWETREERERRDTFPPPRGSPPRSFEGSQRPLSSRLTDAYTGPSPGPGPADDRSYAPPPPSSRDIDRSRPPLATGLSAPPPPPFTRVRQRSPSPVRRPGPGPIDDTRPPMKRPREDAYPPGSGGGGGGGGGGYYSPQARDPPPRRTDYPGPQQRVPSPPPSSGNSYYDRGGPPPSSAGTTGSGPSDREYGNGRDRVDYAPGPASYERPRSPPPPPPSSRLAHGYSRGGGGGGGAYGRPGDVRDDRRYNMPPPPPRTS